MERPSYGRTGLLDSKYVGQPVTRPRLVALPAASNGVASAGTALKWYPDLLTVPQSLLELLCEREGSLPPSCSHYLRAAAVAEALRRRWASLPRPALAAVQRQALAWCAAHPAAVPAEPLAWYLPDLKLTVVKDGAVVHSFPHRARHAVTLCGKDRHVNDVALDHPSCSAQHAALQVQWVLSGSEELDAVVQQQWPSAVSAAPPTEAEVLGACAALQARLLEIEEEEREAGGSLLSLWSLELQLVDLGSTNGTRVNKQPLKPFTPFTIMDGDVVEFGLSSRQYVFMQSATVAA